MTKKKNLVIVQKKKTMEFDYQKNLYLSIQWGGEAFDLVSAIGLTYES